MRKENDPGSLPPEKMLKEMGLTKKDMPILEEYLANGMNLIHGEKTRDQMIAGLQKAGLGQTMMRVLERLDMAGEVPDLVKFVAGFALLNQLAELGETVGMESSGEARMQAFAEVLGEELDKGIRSGKYDPQELKDAGEAAAKKLKIQVAK